MILGAGCIDWTLVESDIVQKFVAGQKWSHLEKDWSKVLTPPKPFILSTDNR